MFDAENTIKLFAEQYYEKIFYFSLKKTGNRTEAEDLTSDIILDVISALRKGIIPEYFSAYVWKVARSRFSKWSEKKVNSRKYLDANNFDGLELRDDTCDVENSYIQKEDINNLRREISLISKEYREILVSFYIDDKKIPQIAKEFNLPEGTVKTKLFKSRKILQEGMKMAREFGIKSYKPENVDFSYSIEKASEGYPFGQPWNLLKKLVAKNIVLEAYNNPSTIEELSLELGIAAPYLEDELKYLLEPELMIKHSDGRLETNFIILDSDTQKQIMELSEETGKRICPPICEIVDKNIDKIKNIGFMNHDIPKEYLYWCLLYIALEKLIFKVNGEKNTWLSATERPNGDKWDVTGFEDWKSLIGYASTVNRTNDGNSHFDHFKFDVSNLHETVEEYGMSGNELFLLTDIIKNNRNKSTLDASENKIVDSLVNHHVITISEDKIKISFPVFNESEKQELTAYFNIINEIYDGIVYKEFENIYNSICEIISKALPERFKNNRIISREAANCLYNFRCILLRYAYDREIVKIPDGVDRSAITMYLTF